MQRQSNPVNAFTLIELLIVVAIIAILAAIAVPNFLEAQTRSKVSRAKADMRTLRTGLEAYAMDNNRYIPDANIVAQPQGNDEFSSWVPLTTPVAFITSVLTTPFKVQNRDNNPWGSEDVFEYWGPNFWPTRGAAVNAFVTGLGYTFIFGTVGPDLKWSTQLIDINDIKDLEEGRAPIYDPTNGTISNGDIYGSNKRNFH